MKHHTIVIDSHVLLITHDIHTASTSYSNILTQLTHLGSFLNCMENAWLLATALSCREVYEKLSPLFDTMDHILIVELSGDWAFYGMDKSHNKWLKNYLRDTNPHR